MQSIATEGKKRTQRRRQPDKVETADRLPPHSPEAEVGVLGCIMLSPDICLPECQSRFKSSEVFYDLANQTIYNAMVKLAAARKPVEIIQLHQVLKDSNQLEQVGGHSYLSTLEDKVPSVENLGYWADIVDEKYRLRRIVHTCTEVVDRIYSYSGPLDDLMFSVQSDLGDVFGSQKSAGRFFTVDDLDSFDPSKDQNSLIGNRWLCRGGKLLIPSASGAGKSSLGMQMLTLFALGKDFCGIQPARPLSSLICGDENDIGDMAEMFQGTRDFLKIECFNDEEAFKTLRQNMSFWHCPALSGAQFLAAIERRLREHPRDIVLLDPLVSFAGVDLTRQDSAAQFLRSGLSRISEETGVIWFVIHHTPKTSRDPKSKSTWKASDFQYAGAGSFDLPGWARAVMTLDEAKDGLYRLILAKRGNRAGAKHPNGQPTIMLWMRHAEKGIHWQQVEPPEEAEPSTERKGGKPNEKERVAGMNLYDFCSACAVEGEGLNQISKRLERWLAKHGEDLSAKTCSRIVPLLVKNGKLAKGDDSLYRKGKQA